jgi:predicted amidohydrolase
MLNNAASSYDKSGFENVADWALATSIYFDAAWHLIQANKELDINEKGRLLGIGSNYLKSSLELFNKAGYKNKVVEVQDRLNRVEKEESILFSALNTIKEPSISRSTIGIVAPSCPIESSQSPRLGEARQFTEEELRVTMERMERKKYELIYKDLVKEYSKVQRRECRVGIAQIGVSETGDIIDELYEMSPSGLLKIRENKIEKVRSQVKVMIEKAHNEGVNILLFPEMTIDLNYGEVLKEIADQAKLYGMYIVPGSFHEAETKRNISMVFGPEGILWEQEKHIPATISFEAGKKFKEGIEVSSLPRRTIICNTEYGRIAIAICRDFLDMDLRVELKNSELPIDIILNPAFTPVTADFKAAHFDARRSIYAYSFFANIGEYGESLIYTPEKDRTERIIPAKEEGLIFKDIDLFKLRSERKKWEKEQGKERLFIQSTR